jgi:hypothetical protein
VDEPKPATVVGTHSSLGVVYTETLQVPVSNSSLRIDFPDYTPTQTGEIIWEATVEDDDPDDDTATATTDVVN